MQATYTPDSSWMACGGCTRQAALILAALRCAHVSIGGPDIRCGYSACLFSLRCHRCAHCMCVATHKAALLAGRQSNTTLLTHTSKSKSINTQRIDDTHASTGKGLPHGNEARYTTLAAHAQHTLFTLLQTLGAACHRGCGLHFILSKLPVHHSRVTQTLRRHDSGCASNNTAAVHRHSSCRSDRPQRLEQLNRQQSASRRQALHLLPTAPPPHVTWPS